MFLGIGNIIMSEKKKPTVVIIGLGYVGLPLAIALARHYAVVGYDINTTRIEELHRGHDRTGEISDADLRSSSLLLTSNVADIAKKDIYIITVPTPVTNDNQPDLRCLESASETVGDAISKGAIVVYESTVYPGITEDFCGPILEKKSGLRGGKDFFLGYSPERINPGDKVHTVEKIIKVVAGQTPEVTAQLAEVYGSINNGKTFIARNIKTAEAAKVIENAQRDINIAFINEITMIFSRMGISIFDVLEAANTKWNFLKFLPGLVGGHCIGVDPYYLAHAARRQGYEPAVILSGRRINENMNIFLASSIHELLHARLKSENGRILILGLTFKEDVPDLRNTKVFGLIQNLKQYGYRVEVHDPLADQEEAKQHYDLDLHTSIDGLQGYDCLVGAVAHHGYHDFIPRTFERLVRQGGIVADIKNMWNHIEFPKHIHYWSL